MEGYEFNCFSGNGDAYLEGKVEGGSKGVYINKSRILLDPLFWSSLGKAMGWREKYKHHIDNSLRPALRCTDCGGKPMVGSGHCSGNLKDEWLTNWHRFIDHLAEGKDANSFFSDLLNSNK